MLSPKWRPFCHGLNVLIKTGNLAETQVGALVGSWLGVRKPVRLVFAGGNLHVFAVEP